MRRNIITTAVFLIGITVYLALLGHIVQNQSVMQREECAQAAKIYADELEKDFGTSLSVTETLAYMIADTGERPQHFTELAKEMLATRPCGGHGESRPLLAGRPTGKPRLQP